MTVSHFPANRRLLDVRRCAAELLNLHGEDANAFWRTEMSRFVEEMRGVGAGEVEIRKQAALFLQAVQTQLEYSYHLESSSGG